jgi:hypothetical protein
MDPHLSFELDVDLDSLIRLDPNQDPQKIDADLKH